MGVRIQSNVYARLACMHQYVSYVCVDTHVRTLDARIDRDRYTKNEQFGKTKRNSGEEKPLTEIVCE